ncbi:MAG: hypothetical protein EPN93_21070 [Spirochaetes bacterium]|nr:MAG: hypothetical protein EPN93_21070 [Spirochaetota bacterium]
MKRSIAKPCILAALLFVSCMGTGDIEPMKSTMDDSAVGRFMRELGPGEMDVLLNDPNDPAEPGLPIDHLLYLIDKCSVDKMVEVVKRCGARKTLHLMSAIRRLGCNRPVAGYPLGRYDIPGTHRCADCGLDDYNYLDAVARLVDGMVNAGKLVSVINRLGLEYADPATDDAYMEKLAFLIVYLDDPVKIIALVNGVIDARDIVFFIDQMDAGTAPPVSTPDIVSGAQLRGLGVVVALFRGVVDPGKMHYLVNGARTVEGPGDDAAQIEYLRHKLLPVIAGGTDPTTTWIRKLSVMINGVTRMERLRSLMRSLAVADIPLVVDVWTRCDSPDLAPPHENSIGTMARVVDGVEDPAKLVTIMGGVTPAHMAGLVNGVAAGSRLDDDGNADAGAAGRKLAAVIDGTADIDDLVFVMNNVSAITAMADLMNALRVASAHKVSILLNDIEGPNSWNPLLGSSATGVGKLVNMIDNVTTLADTARLLDGVGDPAKLSGLINLIGNSSLLVGFINAVIADPRADIADLTGLINGLDLSDVPKTARIISDLNGTRDALMASLIAPYAADASAGLGHDHMAGLIHSIGALDEAGRLAGLLASLNPVLAYNGSSVTVREGLVRLMRAGVVYQGRAFPGLGSVHVAAMINSADGAADLAAVMNGTGIEMMVPMIGCGDRVGDPGGDGLPPFDPDFRTPCTACGMGW